MLLYQLPLFIGHIGVVVIKIKEMVQSLDACKRQQDPKTDGTSLANSVKSDKPK